MNNKENTINICFCMYRIITGGIEKCLLRFITNFNKDKYNKYNISIVVKEPIKEQYFLDFFNKYNVKIITINNKINKKKAYRLLNSVDVIIDYFNCDFYLDLQEISVPIIGVYHSSINVFDRQFVGLKDCMFNTYEKFVCLTKSFKNDVIERYPQYKDKIVQLYNPINIEELRNLSEIGECPNNNLKYFVFLGRFDPDKDHNCVIDAFYKFTQRMPNARIYFLGAGYKENEYREKIKRLHLEDKIIFTGAIANPYGYLKNSIANILSSPNEGLSNVLIEAAVLGVLNISSDCKSSASEVLMNGEAGILFPIGDSDALANIMYDVWNNDINTSELIETALKNIYRFDSNNIYTQLVELINTVINSAKKNRKYKYKLLKKIFSINYSYNKTHIIITILGIKIKIRRKKK